jgi:uncharacterized lipoprotein YmbA
MSSRAMILPGSMLVAVTLTACRSAPTHIFTLEPVPPPSVSGTYGGPPIHVDAVHVPPGLDRTEIVSSAAPGELEIHDLDQWPAALGEVARQALTADLIARLPPDRVIFPRLPKPAGARGLTVDVLEFKTDPSGATLQAAWVLSEGPGQPAGTPGGGELSAVLHTAHSGTGAAATARALSDLLAKLADRIVASL